MMLGHSAALRPLVRRCKRWWRALKKDGVRATWAAAMQRRNTAEDSRPGAGPESNWALRRLSEQQPGKQHVQAWRLQAQLAKLEAQLAAKDATAATQREAFEQMRLRLKELGHDR